jgi:catechol 2,3-dioxygenase
MRFHQSPIVHVGKVILKVTDLERSLQFYQQVIGFEIKNRTETTADLTADGKTVLLTLKQPDDVIPKKERTTGLYHFALLLPSREHLAQIIHHLTENGIRFGSSDHLVSEALYLWDPDGNGIEIYRDRDPSEWEWQRDQVKMAVDPLRFQELLAIPVASKWEKLPPETVVGHIHLHVAWLDQAERFYVDGLGFEVVLRYGPHALFIADGKYHHHVGLNTWNGVGAPQPPPQSAGLEAYSLIYPDESARMDAVNRLQKMGFAAEEMEGEMGWTVCDPSGNRIVLQIASDV